MHIYSLQGNARWENLPTAIERATESCKSSGHAVSDHFRGVTEMVKQKAIRGTLV
jgi:DNA-damage-inducible protein D